MSYKYNLYSYVRPQNHGALRALDPLRVAAAAAAVAELLLEEHVNGRSSTLLVQFDVGSPF
jgi:hypothetical protein